MNKQEAQKYKVPTFKVKMVRDNRGGELITLNASTAAHILNHNIGDLPHEEVWMLTINAKSQVSGAIKIAQGGIHGCGLLPRDILSPAIASVASGFVLGHNHPSGDPTPSREDIDLTKRVLEAGKIVGVPLLDHVVIAHGNHGLVYRSMFEERLM